MSPPTGYDFVECWTGTDSIFFHEENRVEVFGIVFRSQARPFTYLFSFRGTYALLDVIEDLAFFEGKDVFVPFTASTAPDHEARVASGFWSIYTDSAAGTASMQSQLFGLVKKYQASDKPIDRLWITGHSLGAALCELFTLDLALSEHSTVPTSTYDFAGPRVGDRGFARLYGAQPQEQLAATRTLRIQNTYDLVPCGPPTSWFGYEHVGDAYLVAFYNKTAGYLDPLAKLYDHQALNYQAVLTCALQSEDGFCISDDLKVPADAETLVSLKPDPSSVCSFWV